jgi:hypothetical protein
MIVVDDVAAHLGLAITPGGADEAWCGDVVDAVNVYVDALPVVADRDDPAADWPATVRTGAIMLAAHLYHSRSSPYGRATLDPVGGFQQAYADPEIARLLCLRRYAKPRVG